MRKGWEKKEEWSKERAERRRRSRRGAATGSSALSSCVLEDISRPVPTSLSRDIALWLLKADVSLPQLLCQKPKQTQQLRGEEVPGDPEISPACLQREERWDSQLSLARLPLK